MIGEGDPTALALLREYKGVRMPNLQLSDEEVALLVGYLDQATRRR